MRRAALLCVAAAVLAAAAAAPAQGKIHQMVVFRSGKSVTKDVSTRATR